MFNQYILILVWIGFVALLANQFGFKREEVVCGERVQRFMPWFAFFSFAPVIWMAGNRGWIGDTVAYARDFWGMPESFIELPAYILTRTKDTGFYLFSAIIKLLTGNDKTIYFTILAMIQGIVIITIFRKYSRLYILSVFLFIASSDYISWMYNGLRQFMAVTIIFSATSLMLKKKYVPLLIVILLASTMHQSALIMIPLVLIAQGEAWNKKTIFFMAVALVAITFVGEFTTFLDTALEDTQYTNVVSDYTSWEDNGTNPLRVAVYSVPAILAFVKRKLVQEYNNPVINLCTNMSIVSMGFYIISMFTSGIFIGRLPIYASLYGYILLPWEIENLFTRESKKVVYTGLIGGYLVFYYYQMHTMFGLI